MPLLHIGLCLTQRMHLVHEISILSLEVQDLRIELLDLTIGRLIDLGIRVDVLPLQGRQLVTQPLILFIELSNEKLLLLGVIVVDGLG